MSARDEITALGGWRTFALVQHCVRGVDKARMLKNAMARQARM